MSGLLQPPTSHAIRPARSDDQAYIASTWWRSMLGGRRAPRQRRRINAQIDRILDDTTTRALVTLDRDRIIGWLVFASAPSMRVLHYVYVRDDERGRGVARRMADAAWPGSDARMVLTMKGPDTKSYVATKRSCLYVPIEEFFR